MSGKGYAVVNVTVNGGQVTCTPDWVNCFWEVGPDNIRWVFNGIPANVASAAVEFFDQVPAKYPYQPPLKPGFRPRGVFRGLGHAAASAGSHLQDLVTSGNTQEQGYFFYNLLLYDGNGAIIAKADPGGGNDGGPPGTQWP